MQSIDTPPDAACSKVQTCLPCSRSCPGSIEEHCSCAVHLLLQAHLPRQGLHMRRQLTSHAICLSLAEAPLQTASTTCMCWTLRACTGPVLPLRATLLLLEQVICAYAAPSPLAPRRPSPPPLPPTPPRWHYLERHHIWVQDRFLHTLTVYTPLMTVIASQMTSRSGRLCHRAVHLVEQFYWLSLQT